MHTAEEVENIARSLIQAQETSLGTEVSTHVCYPDGSLVRVVVLCQKGSIRVSDGSFGTLYLAKRGIKLVRQQVERLRISVLHYDCKLVGGIIYRDVDEARLADSIALVANASRALADYGTEFRRVSDSEFRLSVFDRLRGIVGSRLREKEPVAGISGRSYKVGGVVLDKHQASPVAFVESFATRATVSDRFAEFYDLKKAHVNVRMMSIYDDALDWPKSDLNLLEQVSSVIAFSKSQSDLAALQ